MNAAGFSKSEINDFIKYWIPELTNFPFYVIYPQFRNTLDLMTEIQFSMDIDYLYRLHYYIRGSNDRNLQIEKPVMVKAKRNGFYAMEWGVIIK